MSAFKDIKDGLLEAIEHSKGNEKVNARLTKFDDIDIKALRHKLNLSQQEFAEKFYINLRTLQNWEQKIKSPTGASLVLLKVIEKNPLAVEQALHNSY
ncbi:MULTISPECIES: NadS family protein [Francisellaceae]|uniref:NadS family protein n=1 Tax=Francisellaceae TaxID=34064 RepID=UPI0008F9C418|nr:MULTISPECIES: NadS family protein [Francisellaceae]MBK2045708.1 helix-turn-helix domain-containing protein [Allofrancisella guangzhouensis]OIN85111.1 helix-turn-helix family protein [Francisella sp. TX07-6608]TDT66948.1 putative transcriptional regulator [Allofrancisella inopinata]